VESEKLRSEAKIESEMLTSSNNSRNLPRNVTIREEYVKCGKIFDKGEDSAIITTNLKAGLERKIFPKYFNQN